MSQTFQPVILHFDVLDSTNAEAIRQAQAGAPEGVCVMARAQTKGRGRHGRAWSSPKDAGLYFSIVLRPRVELARWSLITLMSALAVREMLIRAIEIYRGDARKIEVDIKWSNDVLINNRKVCGILAEAFETETGRACVVGIGINLRRDAYPQELSDTAISIEEAIGAPPSSEIISRELVSALQSFYARFLAPDGAEEIRQAWTAASTYSFGKFVRVAAVNEVFEGTTRGLEPDGALRVELSTGEIKIVRAGDVAALRAK
jgi:BirA family biotin operon repressor/biotin-[acetyl-CoA-carboxylase] ligase